MCLNVMHTLNSMCNISKCMAFQGNVTIAECDPNGKHITLENTHRSKDENIGEHKLKRKLDGNRREIIYSIPANIVLKAGKTIKVSSFWSNLERYLKSFE